MSTFATGTPIGVKDMHGTEIRLGDRVRYNLQGSHTKPEYWNPEYRVVYDPPGFTLKHVGGGKDGGSHDFMLRCGGGNGNLEIIQDPTVHEFKIDIYNDNYDHKITMTGMSFKDQNEARTFGKEIAVKVYGNLDKIAVGVTWVKEIERNPRKDIDADA